MMINIFVTPRPDKDSVAPQVWNFELNEMKEEKKKM